MKPSFQVCCAAERAARLRELIDRDGEVIKTNAGIRDHPALKHEIACRSFVCHSLVRLGLDLEPVRESVGRPPSASIGIGWWWGLPDADQA